MILTKKNRSRKSVELNGRGKGRWALGAVISFVLFCVVSRVAQSENYVISPATTVNVSNNLGKASQLFLESKVKDLISEKKNPNNQSYDVELRIVRFSRRASVMVKVINQAKKTVWIDEISVANPDDMDKALTILARSIVKRKKSKARDNIHLVTDAESEDLNQRQAIKKFEIALGGLYLKGFDGDAGDLMTLTKIAWSYDIRNIIGGFDFELGVSEKNNHYTKYGIFMMAPLSDNRNTMYVGGGLNRVNLLYAKKSGDDSGLAVSASTGYIFGRSDSVHFKIDAGVNIPLFKVRDELIVLPQISIGVGF